MDVIATFGHQARRADLFNFIWLVVLHFSIFLSFNEKNKETIEERIQFVWQIIIRNPVLFEKSEYMPD